MVLALIEEFTAIAERTAGKGNPDLVIACADAIRAAFAVIDAEHARQPRPFPVTGIGPTPH
jgi:hypothetical protein